MYLSITKSYARLSQIGHFHFRVADLEWMEELIKFIKSNGCMCVLHNRDLAGNLILEL